MKKIIDALKHNIAEIKSTLTGLFLIFIGTLLLFEYKNAQVNDYIMYLFALIIFFGSYLIITCKETRKKHMASFVRAFVRKYSKSNDKELPY